MTQPIPYIVQGHNITIFLNGNPVHIGPSHLSYEEIQTALEEEQWDKVKSLVDPAKVLIDYSDNNISIKGETFYWKGQELHNSMTSRFVKIYKEKKPIKAFINFIENMMLNPSNRAINELYGFLEKNSLPITHDGYFLAYKTVTDDYLDCYTQKIDNSIGQIVTMDRNMVDDNYLSTCSYGLHFCSLGYLGHYTGNKTMVLKIHPKDVVSIPCDYNNSKGRCCQYEVIGEIGVTDTLNDVENETVRWTPEA